MASFNHFKHIHLNQYTSEITLNLLLYLNSFLGFLIVMNFHSLISIINPSIIFTKSNNDFCIGKWTEKETSAISLTKNRR